MSFTIGRKRALVIGLALGLFVAALCGGPAGLLAPLTQTAQAQAPTRRALLVGISNYEVGTNPIDGWRHLNTGPDLEHMRYVLDTYYGFKSDGMHVLRNEQATQEGIIREFRQHLISNARPGDVIVFYYTGHGFQVPDVSGDEVADHDDEVTVSWVPGDKQKLPDEQRRAMMYVLDDTYEQLLRELAQKMRGPDGKVQGSITVIFDSCNSGSATKGMLIPKGRAWDPKIDGPRPAAPAAPDVASGWLSNARDQLAGVTFIAGSQSNQYSYMMPDSETDGSILTHYLTEYLTTLASGKSDLKVTYKNVMDKVRAEVLAENKPQDPQVEGNLNSEIFGDGQPVDYQSLPTVRRVLPGAKQLELNVGSLHGITAGSRFDLYKGNGDVKNPANKLAELELTEVRATTCVGNILNPATPAPPPSAYQGSQAVATAIQFAGKPLKVFVQKTPATSPPARARENALADAITSQAFLTRSASENNFDVTLGWCEGVEDDWCKTNKGQFFYRRANGKNVALGTAVDAASLRKMLLADWRRKYLTTLTLPGRPKVTIEMVAKDGTPIRRDAGGKILLKPGDEGQIRVTNTSGSPMFITLLYLKDSGEIEVWPGTDLVNAQQPLNSDSKPVSLFNITDITAPDGPEVEVLKIIATPRAADFTDLAFKPDERKGRAKGPRNPLEDLLLGFVDASPKGGKISTRETDNWYTDQITYEIRDDAAARPTAPARPSPGGAPQARRTRRSAAGTAVSGLRTRRAVRNSRRRT
jgi:hypothetical protein